MIIRNEASFQLLVFIGRKKANANANATSEKGKTPRDATWHGWSGRVLLGFNNNNNSFSLSLLPCQSVTPSYDPGESVFVCLSLSTTLSLSLYKTTSTNNNNNSYLFFSLYLFICLPLLSLSLSLSSYLSSPCIHALIPLSLSAYPLSPFHSSNLMQPFSVLLFDPSTRLLCLVSDSLDSQATCYHGHFPFEVKNSFYAGLVFKEDELCPTSWSILHQTQSLVIGVVEKNSRLKCNLDMLNAYEID
ncbi:hypothetical protein VNO77_01573 [Canavalia gladiata]|uniref:Uncharacterized protein n=1 Tax=Canavalia gladiata TaxID=3824 RepID=A0AAN9R539_CANGL